MTQNGLFWSKLYISVSVEMFTCGGFGSDKLTYDQLTASTKVSMNNVYIACRVCNVYLDAGYRWAYWMLDHAGVVRPGHLTTSQALLAADAYWNPPREQETQWLYEQIFPPLRQFLTEHMTHPLTYGEIEDFISDEEYDQFVWMEVGQDPSLSPRYCREVLGFSTWEQVERFVEQQRAADRFPPWWWNEEHEGIGRAARRAFERGSASGSALVPEHPQD
jgi:hypothetical protein